MTPLERVLAALQCQPVDRVPTFEWLIDRRVIEALFPGADLFGFVENADLDAVAVYEDSRKQWKTGQTYVDEWGITWAVTAEEYPTSVDFPLRRPEQLADVELPDPDAEWRYESLRSAVKRFKGKRAVIFRLRDAYSLPRYLRGMENLMMDLVLNPGLVRALVELSVGYYTRVAHRAMELGADLFFSSDDYCDNRGPVMGARRWREFFLPGLRQLVASVKKEGYLFIKHCDGNINPIADDLVDAGIDCLDPIDSEAGVDLGAIKAKYGARVAIKGGVPVGSVLSSGTAGDTLAAVKRCLLDAGGGGYVLSSSSDITASVKPANYLAMLTCLREYGWYPLDVERLREGKGSKEQVRSHQG